jgi:adenosylcobinamide kinase/adenosylcobinamide-phosphate guanylyltransferase
MGSLVIRLVLGGEKSGKSAFALEKLCSDPAPRGVVATGRALDLDFRRRLNRHRRERSPDITVLEAGPDLARTVHLAMDRCDSVLVEGLDFWLWSCLESHGAGEVETRTHDLVEVLASRGTSVVTLVSLEMGLGPMAADAATRRLVRSLGRLNQTLARQCHEAWLVAAGLSLPLKRT